MCVLGYIIFITGKVKKVNSNIKLSTIFEEIDKKYLIKARFIEDKEGLEFNKYISKEKLEKENIIYYYTKEAMDVREFLVVKCEGIDREKINTIEKDINTRIEDQKSKFLSYGVGQYDLLIKSKLIRQDPYILYVVDENAEVITEKFKEEIYSDIN